MTLFKFLYDCKLFSNSKSEEKNRIYLFQQKNEIIEPVPLLRRVVNEDNRKGLMDVLTHTDVDIIHTSYKHYMSVKKKQIGVWSSQNFVSSKWWFLNPSIALYSNIY